jgi:regulator of sigma E protease
MYIFLAILAFSILIFVHELGHFLAAKAGGVRVLEFALGMGPILLKKQGKETLYSLRLFPVGGFCALEGEDVSSDDPRAFTNQSMPKRMVILAAGAAMNFLLGFLLILLLFSQGTAFSTPVISGFMEGCPYEGEQGFLAGDEIYKVNGERVYYPSNFTAYITRSSEEGRADLVLIRDGKKVYLNDYAIVPVPLTDSDGATVMKYGLIFQVEEATPLTTLRQSWYCSRDFVRIVRVGLTDLVTGRASINDLTGVVGIVGIISETGQEAESAAMALGDIAYMMAFIAINLAVINLLPLPALDGGRVLGLLLTWSIQKITRRKLNPRFEGYVHFVGLVLLLGLMVYVTFNDIVRLIS